MKVTETKLKGVVVVVFAVAHQAVRVQHTGLLHIAHVGLDGAADERLQRVLCLPVPGLAHRARNKGHGGLQVVSLHDHASSSCVSSSR